jgi:hypothetical protein
MRRHLLGFAILLLGGALAVADEPGTLAPIEIVVEEGGADTPRPLPPDVGGMPSSDCPTCLPDPPCKFLPDPCTCAPTAPPKQPSCCPPAPRYWANLQYMLWTISDGPLDVPIFTQGPTTAGGIPGAANVRTIYGGDEIDFGSFNGGRAEFGYWCNSSQTIGVDVRGFILERGSEDFRATSGANDVLALARSYRNALTGAEAANFVTAPPNPLGSAFANASTQLWGANSDLILNVRDRSTYRVDALIGLEYLDLRETLTMGDNTFFPLAPGANTVQIVTEDSFATRNQFYGTDLGVRGTLKRGRFDCSAAFKVGLGVTHEVLDIAGRTDVIGPAAGASFPAGFLAVESNSGRYVRDRFACVPEANFQIGYRLCKQCHAFVAYDLLYWSNVMRPGDQIDHTVNPLQVPILAAGAPTPVAALQGPVRPLAPASASDLFAQGVSLGVGVTY